MEKEPGRWRALERTEAKARKTQGKGAKRNKEGTSSDPGKTPGSREELEGLLPTHEGREGMLPTQHHFQGATRTIARSEATRRHPHNEFPPKSEGIPTTQWHREHGVHLSQMVQWVEQ